MRRQPIVCSVLFLCLAALPAGPFAQESAPSPAAELAAISPVKQQLIREYFELSGGAANARAAAAAMIRQNAGPIDEALKQMVAAQEFGPEVDEAVVAKLVAETRQRMLDRLIEAVNAIDWDTALYQAGAPILDSIFSEAELQDLLRFLRTDTGRKMVRETPRLLESVMGRTKQVLGSTMEATGRGIGMEEAQKLLEKFKALKK